MEDDALAVVRAYRVQGQADEFTQRLERSGILATVIYLDSREAGWGVAVPVEDVLLAGLIAAGTP